MGLLIQTGSLPRVQGSWLSKRKGWPASPGTSGSESWSAAQVLPVRTEVAARPEVHVCHLLDHERSFRAYFSEQMFCFNIKSLGTSECEQDYIQLDSLVILSTTLDYCVFFFGNGLRVVTICAVRQQKLAFRTFMWPPEV